VLAARIIDRFLTTGHLTLIDANGRAYDYARSPGPSVTVRLHDPSLHWKLAVYPSLYVGEAYTDGTLTIEKGTLRDFLRILLLSEMKLGERSWVRVLNRIKRWFYRREVVNRVGRARQNVKHHYDLSAELYRLFLDEDRQYSCAYYKSPDDTIDRAQLQKKQHIAAKLLLGPGQHVLDIGCGWGGLAIYLARTFGVRVTGLTLSEEQFEIAKRRVKAADLGNLVTIKLLDYRQETGTYDRIVSVGMFEHVGEPQFDEYFDHLDRLMKTDGVALVHTIGRSTQPYPINVWIRRYIFPGAYLPSLSQLVPIFEARGIWLNDFENLRLHYARTLKAWDENVQANRERIAAIYDDRFCRMWEFYLQSCEMGFRHSGLTVFQLLLSKRIDAVPLTRDYMYDAEERLGRITANDAEAARIPAE